MGEDECGRYLSDDSSISNNISCEAEFMDNEAKAKAILPSIMCGNYSFKIKEMKNEKMRLETFKHWPITWISPKKMAKTGFFYLGESDKVMCAFCFIIIEKWEGDDEPIGEHIRWSEHCPLVCGRECGNERMSRKLY